MALSALEADIKIVTFRHIKSWYLLWYWKREYVAAQTKYETGIFLDLAGIRVDLYNIFKEPKRKNLRITTMTNIEVTEESQIVNGDIYLVYFE